MLSFPLSEMGGRWSNAHDQEREPELDIADGQYHDEKPMWKTVLT